MVTRFRAAERDVQSDAERLGGVLVVVRRALRSIEREKTGLGRRLEEARARAATLMGTEDGIYAEREPDDEQMLVEAETQMMHAYDRLKALASQQTALASAMKDIAAIADEAQSSELVEDWREARPARSNLAREVAAFVGWAILIGIALSVWFGAAPPVGLSPDLSRFLAVLVCAVALGIGYPRHRPLLFVAGLACLVELEVARSVFGASKGVYFEALAKAAGLAVVLMLVSIVERFLWQRQGADQGGV